jgi:hypothetical protein
LKVTRETFLEALPEHNPNDSAMKIIFATLPLPSSKIKKPKQINVSAF